MRKCHWGTMGFSDGHMRIYGKVGYPLSLWMIFFGFCGAGRGGGGGEGGEFGNAASVFCFLEGGLEGTFLYWVFF